MSAPGWLAELRGSAAGRLLGIGAALMPGLALWGVHGEVPLLGGPGSGWAPGRAGLSAGRTVWIPGLPWDQEWISFAVGVAALLALPGLWVRRGLGRPLSAYGFGLPAQRGPLWRWTAGLAAIGLVSGLAGGRDPAMRALYPMWRTFRGPGEFLIYEIGYFSFFCCD